MHKVFGIKENVEYLDREGAYLIPCHGHQIGVVKTTKGYFFLGGGLEKGENHLDCIQRECLEEVGWLAFVEGKVCSAEAFIKHPAMGYFHPIQTYYWGKLIEKEVDPMETDHHLCWIEYDQLKRKMCLEMQNWALEQVMESVREK